MGISPKAIFLNKIWRGEGVSGPFPYAKYHRCGFNNVGVVRCPLSILWLSNTKQNRSIVTTEY